MSSIQSVFVSIPLVSALIVLLQGRLPVELLLPLALYGLQFIALLVIAIGAAKMGFLKSHTMARLAAILACVPFVSPFVILGIPFGIWSLKLLADPMIKHAFQNTARTSS